jgi:tetratricopeptide (TPR) repeat protein
LVLSWVGRWQDGSNSARRALRLSPRDPFSAIFNGVAAYAEFVGRNYAEAIRLAREAVRARSDFVGAHRVLTAAAGMAGEIELARASLHELRRVQPNISLAWIAEHLPLRQDQQENFLEGMRCAGMD